MNKSTWCLKSAGLMENCTDPDQKCSFPAFDLGPLSLLRNVLTIKENMVLWTMFKLNQIKGTLKFNMDGTLKTCLYCVELINCVKKPNI